MRPGTGATRSGRALLLYDTRCRFCRAASRRAFLIVPRRRLALRDVNDPAVRERYGVTPEAAKRAMHLVTSSGRVSAGAYAVRDLLRLSRWAWPLSLLWKVPGFPWLADRLYAWVADHRYLFFGKNPPGADTCPDGECDLFLRGASGS